jgi:hypothetical protein
MQQLLPRHRGRDTTPRAPWKTWTAWTDRCYVMGACIDVPATAPHLGPRIAPPVPGVRRRLCCALTFSAAARGVRWSESRMVGASVGIVARAELDPD